jgi:hypothetical protein
LIDSALGADGLRAKALVQDLRTLLDTPLDTPLDLDR